MIQKPKKSTASSVAAAIAGMALAFAASSCSSSASHSSTSSTSSTSQSSTATSKGCRIGFAFSDTQVTLYKPLISAVLSEAATKHCTILQSYANGSASKQLADVQTWIGEGVNAIVLLPLDASAVSSIMDQAHAHGVKVIGYAAQLAGEDGSATFANTAAAAAVGDYIAKWLKAQHAASADIAVLGGPPTCIICSERINGALGALKTALPGVHVVATIIGQTAADGYSAMNTVLAGHPDVKVFISEADDGVIGGNRALIAAGKKPASVLFASFDSSEENLQQIASSQLNAVDASLNLQIVGKSIVDAAYNVLRHTQPLNLVTPYVIITSQTKAAAQQLIRVNE